MKKLKNIFKNHKDLWKNYTYTVGFNLVILAFYWLIAGGIYLLFVKYVHI